MSITQDFIRSMLPYAVAVQRQTGISAAVMMAQAALETGWGRAVLPDSNNLFNIKGQGPAGSVDLSGAWEIQNGENVYRDSTFRAYHDFGESVADYADLVSHAPTYALAMTLRGDPAAYAQALQEAGYATDPQYAEKITDIMTQYNLLAEVEQYMVDHPFPDTVGHWAEAEILRLNILRIMTGYDDGTFRPDQPITRAEAAAALSRLLDTLAASGT